MVIGIPKETKKGEFRVAARPAGVKTLHQAGHKIFMALSSRIRLVLPFKEAVSSKIDSIKDR